MFHISAGRKIVVLGAAFTLTLAACGQGSGSASPSADTPESLEDLDRESPIDDFLGVDTRFDFGSDDSQAELAEAEAKAQEAIGACMREQGFEYSPEGQGQFGGFSGGEDELAYFSKEWTEKYGFGVSTQLFPQSEVGPDLLGFPGEGFGEEEYVDPNEDYLDSLSEAERNAFYEALYGKEPDIPEGASPDEIDDFYQDFVPTGCQSEAYEEGFFGGPGQGFYQEFGQELEDLFERVEADPRVTAHRDEVSACLAKDGLEFTTMEALYQDFEQKMGSIGGAFGGDPFEGTGLDPEQMSDEEIDDFFQNLTALSPEDKVKLGEIQAEEIALAQTVVACGGGPLNDEVVLGDIRVEYEQEFLDTNADRLSEFKDSAEGS